MLEAAEQNDLEIRSSALTPEARAFSTRQYYMLAMLLSGPALMALRRAPRGAGLEAWRQLFKRYERATHSRVHSLLQMILRPEPFGQDARAFEVSLVAWEERVARWESMTADVLNTALRDKCCWSSRRLLYE